MLQIETGNEGLIPRSLMSEECQSRNPVSQEIHVLSGKKAR